MLNGGESQFCRLLCKLILKFRPHPENDRNTGRIRYETEGTLAVES